MRTLKLQLEKHKIKVICYDKFYAIDRESIPRLFENVSDLYFGAIEHNERTAAMFNLRLEDAKEEFLAEIEKLGEGRRPLVFPPKACYIKDEVVRLYPPSCDGENCLVRIQTNFSGWYEEGDKPYEYYVTTILEGDNLVGSKTEGFLWFVAVEEKEELICKDYGICETEAEAIELQIRVVRRLKGKKIVIFSPKLMN